MKVLSAFFFLSKILYIRNLRSKRFRVVSEQRKTKELRGTGFSVLATRKMEREPPFFTRSLTVVPRSLLRNCTEALTTQASTDIRRKVILCWSNLFVLETCLGVSAEKKKKGDSPKQSRQRAASENRPDVEKTPPEKKNEKEKVPSVKKPEVSKERTPSEKKLEVKPSEKKPEVAPTEKKPEVTPSEQKPEVAPTEKKPEVAPSEKKPEVTPNEKKPEVTPSETKPAVIPTEKKPEVIPSDKKEETPTEKKGEETIGRRLSDKKPELVRPPIMGVKPFALPRDRATTDSTVRPSAPHPRDRTATSDKGSSQTTSDETASAPAPAAKKPPKFGIGMGGLAGGGLLAEMKQRQERAASLKRVSKVI